MASFSNCWLSDDSQSTYRYGMTLKCTVYILLSAGLRRNKPKLFRGMLNQIICLKKNEKKTVCRFTFNLNC